MFEDDDQELPDVSADDYDRVGEMIRTGQYVGPASLPDYQRMNSVADAGSGPSLPPGYQPTGGALGQQQPSQVDYATLMQQRLDAARSAQEKEIEALYARTGPSESEKWLAIAAALGRPTEYGTPAEIIGNVSEALLGYKRSRRETDTARAVQLAKLRQQYDLAGINFLGKLAGKSGGNPVWSENLKRFVPRNEVVVIGSGMLGDKQVTKYSDGTMGILEPDGNMAVYDAAGNRIGTRARGQTQ